MANPWLKKNPLMSLWLSAANRAAAPVRGQVAAQTKRQINAATTAALAEGMKIWTDALTPPGARKAKTSLKTKRKAARKAR